MAAQPTAGARPKGFVPSSQALQVHPNQITHMQKAPQQPGYMQPPAGAMRHVETHTEVLSSKKLQELVSQIDSREKLDEDVEELLVQIADDFIDSVATFACQLAKHRKSDTLEVKDVALHLERNWNIKIPGFSTDNEVKPFKKPTVTDVHRQRMQLIKKTAQANSAKSKK